MMVQASHGTGGAMGVPAPGRLPWLARRWACSWEGDSPSETLASSW